MTTAIDRLFAVVLTATIGACAGSAARRGEGSPPPSNHFADASVPRTRELPRLVPTSTQQGVVGVPVGWRLYAFRGGGMQEPAFELIPPKPARFHILVRAIKRSQLNTETIDEWLLRFSGRNLWLVEPAPAVRVVLEQGGCPPDAHCTETESATERFVACAVFVDELVVVALISAIEGEVFADLGGYRSLATIAAAGGGIRP